MRRKHNRIYLGAGNNMYTISVEAAVGERSAVRSQVVTRGKEALMDNRLLGTLAKECHLIVFKECFT